MEKIDEKTLKDSVRNTFTRRGKTDPLKIYYEKDMDVLKNSHELKDTWKKYQKAILMLRRSRTMRQWIRLVI